MKLIFTEDKTDQSSKYVKKAGHKFEKKLSLCGSYMKIMTALHHTEEPIT